MVDKWRDVDGGGKRVCGGRASRASSLPVDQYPHCALLVMIIGRVGNGDASNEMVINNPCVGCVLLVALVIINAPPPIGQSDADLISCTKLLQRRDARSQRRNMLTKKRGTRVYSYCYCHHKSWPFLAQNVCMKSARLVASSNSAISIPTNVITFASCCTWDPP